MIFIKKLSPEAIIPTVAHPGEDIGYDLYALNTVCIRPQEVVSVNTGIAIEITPQAGAIIMDRSSMGKKGLKVMGGVVDAGYRGEIVVMLGNVSKEVHYINSGDRVAQLLPWSKVVHDTDIIVAKELSDSKRRVDGFGSSGA